MIRGITVENYSTLRYKGHDGRKHTARLSLSTYTEMLLHRYLRHYGPNIANRG